MKLPISVIILTYNEELNIENCLKSVADWANEIIVVDSFSADKTLEIAKKYTNKIAEHTFINQAQQFNWALDNLEIKNDWILRLDADEYITEELKKEITEVLPKMSDEVSGFYIKRRVYFMNRWIRFGGYYPLWFLRFFRKGKARSEEREMDEHIVLTEGKAGNLKNDFVDNNRKDLTWWTEKHNRYATREANDVVKKNYGIKKKVFYYRLPPFCRVFCYFVYRYFFQLGFLDGKEGLIFHSLHAFWYRFLIDAKIYEHRKKIEDRS